MPQLSHRVEAFTDSVIRSRAIHNPLILPEYGFDLQLIENGFKEGAKASGAIDDWHYNTSLRDYR